MSFKSRPEKSLSADHRKAAVPHSESTTKKTPAKGREAKVLLLAGAVKMARQAKKNGSTVVTTNGCFDILHVGHIRYLEEAKKHGDVLIVGVNSDASVKRNKGPSRPIVPESERAEVIASLKPVDAVFIFDETTPHAWLSAIRPDIHVKGADRTLDQIVEKELVESSGGKIVLATYERGKSTTSIIERVLISEKKRN